MAPQASYLFSLLVLALSLSPILAAPAADEFIKSLEDKSKDLLQSEVLNELNKVLYDRVKLKDGKIQHNIDARKCGLAIHSVVKSWKGVLSGVLALKRKDKRVLETKERHRAECKKFASILTPVMDELDNINLPETKELTDNEKKVISTARICQIIMDKAGDQIYAQECARARL